MDDALWLLDLFCGAGGCSVGYARAGFRPVGVDVNAPALRRYPFPAIRMDAMTALTGGINLDRFAAIHASPPCQRYSAGTRAAANRDTHPDLLAPVLEILRAWGNRTGRPWVVENVPGAPFPAAVWTVEMCGAHRRAYDPATGRTLRLRRHRIFGTNVPILAAPCSCDSTPIGGAYGAGSRTPELAAIRRGGYTPSGDVQRALLGTEWMTVAQSQQAIPPDYTHAIGSELLAARHG